MLLTSCFRREVCGEFCLCGAIGKQRADSPLFGFYLRSGRRHIVEIAEVVTMNPSIAHAILAARFLRVGRPVQRVLLSLSVLCSPFVVNAKENADDIAAPEFSLPGGVYTNDLKVAIRAAADVVRFSLDGSDP